ncbi:ATP-binding protein [Streptomyces sp. NPDC050548]|uniref:ATP-binding protein n=1 Tax=Streptomyces sp. NPDC050548 TaxID=3365629 RepID=UPI0037976C33
MGAGLDLSPPAEPDLARRRVRDHLADWGHASDDPALQDAVLPVSEPATNVVRHGPLLEREFEVAVTALADGSCLIEVSDEGRGEPRLRVVTAAAEAGRGAHGKTVWALVQGDDTP